MFNDMTKCLGATIYFPKGRDSACQPTEIDEKGADIATKLRKGSSMKGKDKKRTMTVPEEEMKKVSSDTRAKTLSPLAGAGYCKRIFDEFFVIGTDSEGLEGAKIKDFAFVKPKKLFQYPNLPEDKNWYDSVP